jgi:D-alanine--poly(phosphoribitol) ligase subunit 1
MTDIINLINDFGQSNPERVAVRHKDEELTYQVLKCQ